MALRVTQYSDFDAAGVPETWARLSALSRHAGMFSTREWCRCWAETFGRSAAVALLVVEDEGGRSVALLPACAEGDRGVRWLRFLGRERVSGDHLDLLCADEEHAPCCDALLEYVQRCDVWDGVLLGDLPRGSPTGTRVRDWATRHGYPWHECEPRVLPYIPLPNSFDAYLDNLPKKMRHNVRHSRARLAETRGAAVRVLRGVEDVLAVLADFFRLHEARWERALQRGSYRDALKRDFLRRFCRVAAERGWARCYVFEVAGVPRSVLIAFHWRDTAYYYQSGWDPECANLSPGVILIAESIAQAIREGLHTYDFLRGDEPYKWRWATQSIEQTTLMVGCRWPARMALARCRAAARVKQAAQRMVGTHTWERLRRTAAVWLS